jgi:hypothetical protein
LIKEPTNFTNKAKVREMIFRAFIGGQIDRDSVISRLEISERQFYRLQNKYILTNNLMHGLYGKESNRSIDAAFREKVTKLYREKYLGFNYEHASEILFERDNIKVNPNTLRDWLLKAKLTKYKSKKPKKYMRRIPKPCFNDMLQLDGTFDDFLGNGQMLCLMHLVDDATKTSLAYLYDAECTQSALDILFKWCSKYGIPESIYSDRHGTYKVNDRRPITVEEELEGKEIRLTEFGKVCNKLGIKQIYAYSPQAKGRVERKHYLYKDRFVKEIKLSGIKTIEEANAYLMTNNGFIDRLNNKFTIEAKEARTANVSLTAAELAQHFTIDTTRTVRNDYTISYNGQILQLAKASIINANSKVQVKLYLNGSIKVYAGKYDFKYTIIENYVKPVIERPIKQAVKRDRAKETSPWRQYTPKTYKSTKTSSSDYLDKMSRFYT